MNNMARVIKEGALCRNSDAVSDTFELMTVKLVEYHPLHNDDEATRSSDKLTGTLDG